MRSYPLGLNRSCIMILRMLQSFLCLAPAYLLGLNMWGLDPKISLPPFGNTAVGLWMILCIVRAHCALALLYTLRLVVHQWFSQHDELLVLVYI